MRCTRCIFDDRTPGIVFDSGGVCNYCHQHDDLDREYTEEKFKGVVERIRCEGVGKKYNVVVGVSGGCDSSYMLHLAKEVYGLRPLAVTFDNTWGTGVADGNLEKMLKKLDVDLWTYRVDPDEYDAIYRSHIEAGIPDIESPTDIALAAVLNMGAEKHGVKYIFEGHNFRTEGIQPLDYIYMDGKYVRSVYGREFKTYPNMPLGKFVKWMCWDGIRKIRPYWYLRVDKEEMKAFLAKEYGWEWYGGFHYENEFCKFFHSYWLPERWGFEQRVASHAAMVRIGQKSRPDAIMELSGPPGYDQDLVDRVVKRLGYTKTQWKMLMGAPKKSYRDFKTYKRTFELMRPFFWLMYKLNRVPKSFYLKYCCGG